MKTTKRLLLVSVMTVIMCVSLIAGATFALFTSESQVNIAVTAGKVDVTAKIVNLKTYSYVEQDGGEYAEQEMTEGGFIYGTATLSDDGNALTLANMVTGDKVEFDLEVTNNSSVSVKYQTIVSFGGNENFCTALEISGFDGDFVTSELSNTKTSKWQSIEVGAPASTYPVTIVLPRDVADDSSSADSIQGKECTMTITVLAVQGNANVSDPVASDPADKTFYVNNTEDFEAFISSGKDFAGETVSLTSDINLQGAEWTSIKNFKGTFEGNGKVITNLEVEGVTSSAGSANTDKCAFFQNLDNATVRDLIFDGVDVANNYHATVLAGSASGTVVIENVTVKNSKISGQHFVAGIIGQINDANADVTFKNVQVLNTDITAMELYAGAYAPDRHPVGGICGHAQSFAKITMEDCVVEGVTITGWRNLGALIARNTCSSGEVVLQHNTVKDTVITVDHTTGLAGDKDMSHGIFVGTGDAPYVDSNTAQNVTFNYRNEYGTLKNFKDATNSGCHYVSSLDINTVEDLIAFDNFVANSGQFIRNIEGGNSAPADFPTVINFAANAEFDLSGYEWQPINMQGFVIEGNNAVIKNLSVSKAYRQAGFISYFGDSKMNNLTFENAEVTGAQAAVVAGHADNVSFTNVTIKGAVKVTYGQGEVNEDAPGLGCFVGAIGDGNVVYTGCEMAAKVTFNFGDGNYETYSPVVTENYLSGYVYNGAPVPAVDKEHIAFTGSVN